MTTTVDPLAAIDAHLAEFELPPIASLLVTAAISAPHVTAQLANHDPATMARELLARANTPTQITAQARRVPRGESVHLSITGLFPDGASVLVYGAMAVPEHGLGADLTPDACMPIPLGALQHTTTPGEVRA